MSGGRGLLVRPGLKNPRAAGSTAEVRGRRSGVVRDEGTWEMGKRSGDCGRRRLAQ